ncbi:MAG: serine--tRNA ligase, partial [Gammaproteobacteria bacterium]|nr:serine--tRNA ligase [Gammaproteobacteria bacterium]
MIDPKLLRSDPDAVARNLARRGYQLDVAALRALEEQRKPRAVEVDRLRAERNVCARAVGVAKGRGEDTTHLIARSESLAAELARAEGELARVQEALEQWQLGLPNLLDTSVPEGRDESANAEVHRWGEPRELAFKPRDHVEL